jgi:hypothetical protein
MVFFVKYLGPLKRRRFARRVTAGLRQAGETTAFR